MRLTAMVAAMIAAAMVAEAGQTQNQHIIVYVQNDASVPNVMKDEAETLASRMFHTAQVQIEWRRGQPSPLDSHHAIAIRLATHTPDTERPGALAYAKPLEGVHIVVYWDRVEMDSLPTEMLAHVMAHEITHILEGLCRHSETGIMKAHWSQSERSIMKTRPLDFAPEDVELIHIGLAKRYGSPVEIMAAANTRSNVGLGVE
jgi:hypothetical protein